MQVDEAAPLAICIAEDRQACEPAMRLLLMSLARHSGRIAVTVFCPTADQPFVDWVNGLGLRLTLQRERLPGAYGWNVKPQALLTLLAAGNDEVVWIDSDIILTGDIASRFRGVAEDVLFITEEALWGAPDDTDGLRCRLWGLSVGRRFASTLNTAVLRVTHAHIPLLERWKSVLESAAYQRAQAQPWHVRPVHMLSDQDVLTALLCSREFGDIPVAVLRRGRDIIQYFGLFGFTVSERFMCGVRGMPLFIHSQGPKPWVASPHSPSPMSVRRKIEATYLDLSPYTIEAKRFASGSPQPWTKPRSTFSAVLRAVGFGYAPAIGLPIAVAADIARVVAFVAKKLRKPASQPGSAFRIKHGNDATAMPDAGA